MLDDFRVDGDEFEMIGHWRGRGNGGGWMFAGLNGLANRGPVECGAGGVGEGLPELPAEGFIVAAADHARGTGETKLLAERREVGDNLGARCHSQLGVFFCIGAADNP